MLAGKITLSPARMHAVLPRAALLAAAISSTAAPSFGPMGCDQAIVTSDGRTLLTCHGSAILRALKDGNQQSATHHALAQPLHAAISNADRIYGDGSITTILFLNEALQVLSNFFPSSSSRRTPALPSTLQQFDSVIAMSSARSSIGGADSSLSTSRLNDFRTIQAEIRIRRMAQALAQFRRQELVSKMVSSLQVVRIPNSLSEVWSSAELLIQNAMSGKYSHGAVQFLSKLLIRLLQESASTSQFNSTDFTSRMSSLCDIYSDPSICVVVPGAPLRESTIVEGSMIAQEVLMPDKSIRRLNDVLCLLLKRDFFMQSSHSTSAEFKFSTAEAYALALQQQKEHVMRVCHWLAERCNIRVLMFNCAVSDVTLFACRAAGMACIQSASNSEMSLISIVTSALIVVPELVSDVFRTYSGDDEFDVHAVNSQLGSGRVRIIEALSLGPQRPAVRVVGHQQGVDRRIHSLLLRAPHEAQGVQYKQSICRLLRSLALWFRGDDNVPPMACVGGGGSFELRISAVMLKMCQTQSFKPSSDTLGYQDAFGLLSQILLSVPRTLFHNSTSANHLQAEHDFQALLTHLNHSDSAQDLGFIFCDPLDVLRGWSQRKGNFEADSSPAGLADSHSLLRVDSPLEHGVIESLQLKVNVFVGAIDTILQILRIDGVLISGIPIEKFGNRVSTREFDSSDDDDD